MKKDTGIYGAGTGMIQTGGFGARLFGYAIFYVPATFLYLTLLYLSQILVMDRNTNAFIQVVGFILVFLPTILPFILVEKAIRKFRRKNGLSVYGNIAKDLEQMKYNEEYAKEAKAREAYEASKK